MWLLFCANNNSNQFIEFCLYLKDKRLGGKHNILTLMEVITDFLLEFKIKNNQDI